MSKSTYTLRHHVVWTASGHNFTNVKSYSIGL